MPVDGHIIDIIFECFDSLEEYIGNLEDTGQEGDLDTSDLVSRLNKIATAKSTAFLDEEGAKPAAKENVASAPAAQSPLIFHR